MVDNIIYFGNKITSFTFYNDFLKDLYNYYKEKGSKIQPIVSLEYTEFIDANTLPNLIGFGLMLRNFHKQPIKLLLNYNPKLIYFLYKSRFFTIVGKYSGLNIFDFDDRFIGGFDLLEKKRHLDEHIVHRYKPSKQYYELDDENEQLEFRKQIIRILRDEHLPKDFLPVLKFLNRIEEYEMEYFLDVLSEIISNSILYSLSESFATVHANKYKTLISIADIGIGFREAFGKKKNYDYSFSKSLKSELKYSEELNDFIFLFEVFHYSKNNDRFNLWRLKETVVNKLGVFRIHFNTTQLVFSKKCSLCEKSNDLIKCAKCFLKNYNSETILSPLRIFNYDYQGVHVEIELYNTIEKEEYV